MIHCKHLRFEVLALPCAALVFSAAACMEDETIRINNLPVAQAGEDQQLDYAGEPVAVRLDGRDSSDEDGEIARYIWRNAVPAADGGAEWASGALDPDDSARPELELEQGTYTFLLWVEDDRGAISAPDSVSVNVGTDPIAQCVADSLQVVPEACLSCVCGAGAECLEATVACREDCWQLLSCIGANCPDSSDTACIVMNCSAALGGAMGATAIGPCIMSCTDVCQSQGTPDGGA